MEVVTTLFAYKCRLACSFALIPYKICFAGLYPNRVGLNRGNHETKDMNKVYGFEGEVRHKHGEQTYKVSSSTLHSPC